MDEKPDFFASGGNASAVMGIDYASKPDQSVTWTVFRTLDGRTIIAPSKEAAHNLSPPRRLGWEGHGGANRDGVEGIDRLAGAIKIMERNVARNLGGLSVANAITALHGQRRPDGRPEFFLPDVTLPKDKS